MKQPNLGYADVKLIWRAFIQQDVHAGSLYVTTTISVKKPDRTKLADFQDLGKILPAAQ